jgi:hypothetical protein
MQRLIHNFESIPSLSTIFWKIPFYKNNVLENNKQVSLNYGKFNTPTELGFMCNTRFKQHSTRNDKSIHSWLNMVGNLHSNRFKVYESCYFQNNPLSGYIQIDYSLLWLDVITNEPFYSPVSQEVSTKLRDKVCVSICLRYDTRLENISDNFWLLLSNSTQKKINIIQETLIQNSDKCITTD